MIMTCSDLPDNRKLDNLLIASLLFNLVDILDTALDKIYEMGNRDH